MTTPEDPNVTHVERPVRFHTSLKELAEFLKGRYRVGINAPKLSHVGVALYAGDEVLIPGLMVPHYQAKRALVAMTRMARNQASSVAEIYVRKYYKDSQTPETMRVLVEAMPLSLAEREDIDALKE